MRLYLVNNSPNPLESNPIPSWAHLLFQTRPTEVSPVVLELMDFKKGTKREIAAYPTLRDERYCDTFCRSLFIIPRSHEHCEILNSPHTPGSAPRQKELFKPKQTLMFSVFIANLLTDQGRTIVRKHLATADAQAIWQALHEHRQRSSKGACEKKNLPNMSPILQH